MTSQRIRTLVIALVALQVIVLVSLPLLRGARIASGTTVELAVSPLDPTDLARGAYVALRYDFQDLELPKDAREDDEAFVVLERPKEAGEPWTAERIVVDEGELDRDDVFLRLRVNLDEELELGPIDTYYDDPDGAKALERELADDGAIAEISLASDGRPTLVRVKPRRDG